MNDLTIGALALVVLLEFVRLAQQWLNKDKSQDVEAFAERKATIELAQSLVGTFNSLDKAFQNWRLDVAQVLGGIAERQTTLDSGIQAGFDAAKNQLTADGDQTRANMITGFGKVGEGMDELHKGLQEVNGKADAILADVTDVKHLLAQLLQRPDSSPDVVTILNHLVTVTDRIWTWMQAHTAEQAEGTESPAALLQSKTTDDVAPHTPETKASEGER